MSMFDTRIHRHHCCFYNFQTIKPLKLIWGFQKKTKSKCYKIKVLRSPRCYEVQTIKPLKLIWGFQKNKIKVLRGGLTKLNIQPTSRKNAVYL